MTQPQRPEDDVDSSSQEEGGEKKQAIKPKVTAGKIAEKPTEILARYEEQDQRDEHEIGNLAIDPDATEPEENRHEEDTDTEHEESARDDVDQDDGSEDEAEILDQEAQEEAYEEQSPETEDETGTDKAKDTESQQEEESGTENDDSSKQSGSNAGDSSKGSSSGKTDKIEEGVKVMNTNTQERVSEGRFKRGEWLSENIYKGDKEFQKSRDPNKKKNTDMLKLEAHPELIPHPRRLREDVQAFAELQFLLGQGVSKDNFSFYHCLEVIRLKDEPSRVALALEINNKKLSVRQTRERVNQINSSKVAPKLAEKLLAKIKDPRSLPLEKDYETMDGDFLENELSKKERLLLRAEMTTKRDQLKACNAFLDLLEQRLSDIDL